MMTTNLARPTFACRRCGERIPAGPLATSGFDRRSRLAFDLRCASCCHRALYSAVELLAV